MKETLVWSLIQEDSTCRAATKPEHHNSWASALHREATAMRNLHATTRDQCLLVTTREKPGQQQRPSTAKSKNKVIKKTSKENHAFHSYSWYHLTHALCDYSLPVISFSYHLQTSLCFPRITNKTGCFIKNQNLNLNPKTVPLSGKVIVTLSVRARGFYYSTGETANWDNPLVSDLSLQDKSAPTLLQLYF